MLLRGSARVLPVSELKQDLLDPFGRKVLLRERHAAIERLFIARDQPVAKDEVRNPLENHRLAFPALPAGRGAKTVTRVSGAPVTQRIEEIPAVVRARVMEVLQHL